MATTEEREINEAAYRRLKPVIAQTYPHGRFVAISGGAIVGDAASCLELIELLRSQGKDPLTVLGVEAGVDYPDNVTILLPREV